jgi:hypothetical protein
VDGLTPVISARSDAFGGGSVARKLREDIRHRWIFPSVRPLGYRISLRGFKMRSGTLGAGAGSSGLFRGTVVRTCSGTEGSHRRHTELDQLGPLPDRFRRELEYAGIGISDEAGG